MLPSRVLNPFAHLLTILLVLGTWVVVLYHYSYFPDVIPTHFNSEGHADKYSSKKMLLLLPVLATVFVCFLLLPLRYAVCNKLAKQSTVINIPQEAVNGFFHFMNLLMSGLFMVIAFSLVRAAGR